MAVLFRSVHPFFRA